MFVNISIILVWNGKNDSVPQHTCTTQIIIAAFSIAYGDYYRLIYGVDSYGNTCGRRNAPITNQSLSGEDLRFKPFVHK